ncbi:hypothetical protein [Nonomuraea sp. bgisy101]|uniref:hypothetical protein n=1 Tax=Nonomuraea sp. bgisy101 TaxID=3413784 RepID=UPI003D72A703
MTRAIRWWQSLRARIGHRGSALLFFGLLDLVFAGSLIAPPLETRSSASYAFLATILPLPVWAVAWGSVGLLCAVQAFMVADRAAFVAASWLKVGWGGIYLAGWLLGEIPRGYVAAAIWLAFAGFVAVIASWPEPLRRP